MFRESKNCKQAECLLTSLRPGRTTQHGRQSQHDCLRLIVVSFEETALCVSPVITYKNFPFCRSIFSQSRNSGRRFMMNLSGCAWFEKGVTWHVLQVQEEKSTFISGKYPPWSQTNWVRVNISFSPSRTSGQKKYLWKWYKLRAILCMDPGNGKTSECLDSLFHWSPVVVDLIQHINDSPTEKYCWIVKVVHEAGKLI